MIQRTKRAELRTFQAIVFIAALVPIAAGTAGIVQGPAMIKGASPANADLASHFAYLSGLLLGIGGAFIATIPGIERHGRIFKTLAFLVIVGGSGRLFAALHNGLPTAVHQLALVMELGVVPLLAIWQERLAKLSEIGFSVRRSR